MTEATKITTLDNGPFLVTGSVLLTDAEGNQFHAERDTIALCRCGASTKKPFCDGAHRNSPVSLEAQPLQRWEEKRLVRL